MDNLTPEELKELEEYGFKNCPKTRVGLEWARHVHQIVNRINEIIVTGNEMDEYVRVPLGSRKERL